MVTIKSFNMCNAISHIYSVLLLPPTTLFKIGKCWRFNFISNFAFQKIEKILTVMTASEEKMDGNGQTRDTREKNRQGNVSSITFTLWNYTTRTASVHWKQIAGVSLFCVLSKNGLLTFTRSYLSPLSTQVLRVCHGTHRFDSRGMHSRPFHAVLENHSAPVSEYNSALFCRDTNIRARM